MNQGEKARVAQPVLGEVRPNFKAGAEQPGGFSLLYFWSYVKASGRVAPGPIYCDATDAR